MLPETIEWISGAPMLRLLDQRKIPVSVSFVDCRSYEDTAGAIENMTVRSSGHRGRGGIWCSTGGAFRHFNDRQGTFKTFCNKAYGSQPFLVHRKNAVSI